MYHEPGPASPHMFALFVAQYLSACMLGIFAATVVSYAQAASASSTIPRHPYARFALGLASLGFVARFVAWMSSSQLLLAAPFYSSCPNLKRYTWHELYWSIGDSGDQFDKSLQGQNTFSLHGSILRIKINSNMGTKYQIPDGNPFKTGGSSGS